MTVVQANTPAHRLDMARVTKAFHGVPVLREVGLFAGAGEVVALLGANGAGKSTLMKILSGIYTCDAGTILVDGRPVSIEGPDDAIAAGIRLMPQELSVHPDLTVAENIALAALPTRRIAGLTVVDRKAMDRQARDLLARLGLREIAPRRRMGSLSLPQQRVVEIARALAGKARILIMDEPTAALSEAEAASLFEVIGALKREGVTILYISHYLDEVFHLSDRIVVLRDGAVSGLFETRQTSHEAVLRAMLGSDLGDLFPAKSTGLSDTPAALAVDGLSLSGWLDDVSLKVRRGELYGVFGLIGSGIEKIGRAIYGAEPAASARAVTVAGRRLTTRAPREGVQGGLGLVAAERKREGLIGIMSVRENTTLAYLGTFTRRGLVDRSGEDEVTRRWIKSLGVRAQGPDQEIRLLSGGNQQKICLARWLLGDVKVLILEEPTRGVDLGARRDIYKELRRLADAGLAVMVISSDAEEVAGLADRTLVLGEGAALAELGPAATAADLLQAASGAALAPRHAMESA